MARNGANQKKFEFEGLVSSGDDTFSAISKDLSNLNDDEAYNSRRKS